MKEKTKQFISKIEIELEELVRSGMLKEKAAYNYLCKYAASVRRTIQALEDLKDETEEYRLFGNGSAKQTIVCVIACLIALA